ERRGLRFRRRNSGRTSRRRFPVSGIPRAVRSGDARIPLRSAPAVKVKRKFKYLVNGRKGTVHLHFQDGEFVSDEFRGILEGKNYPFLYEGPAACILDVGANAGAFSVFAGICYPDARIIACEPSAAVFECLTRNAAMNPNIEAHHIGLYRKDM